MRSGLAVAAVSLLALAPATAAANHVPGATYNGVVTTGEGGSVSLDVSGDGGQVDAEFSGLGNATNSCFGVGFGTGSIPIANHSFTYSANGGQVTANGSFGPSFAAGGAQVLTTPCTTGSQAWIVRGPDAYLDTGGVEVLNDTGENQTVESKIKRGKSQEIALHFSNAGTAPESFLVKGCKSTKHIKFSYSDSNGKQTGDVGAGKYETDPLAAGGVADPLTLKVKVKDSAKKGDVKSCKVSQRSPLFVDVLKARVKVG